jgi:hypothetical protein
MPTRIVRPFEPAPPCLGDLRTEPISRKSLREKNQAKLAAGFQPGAQRAKPSLLTDLSYNMGRPALPTGDRPSGPGRRGGYSPFSRPAGPPRTPKGENLMANSPRQRAIRSLEKIRRAYELVEWYDPRKSEQPLPELPDQHVVRVAVECLQELRREADASRVKEIFQSPGRMLAAILLAEAGAKRKRQKRKTLANAGKWRKDALWLRELENELRGDEADTTTQQPTNPVATPEKGEGTGGAGAAPRQTTDDPNAARKLEKTTKLAKAMILVKDHPDWSDRYIAQQAGYKSHTPLVRSAIYQVAAAMARGQKADMPHGAKSGESGDLEAWSDG